MESELLSLSWNDHSDGLVSVFQHLLNNNTLVDCTLAAEGQYLKAHKVVLSACSPYFQLLFTQESEKNPIIILKDVKFQELKAVIDFVYRGEVKISEDELGAFLEVATSLCIKGLSKNNKSEGENTIIPDFPVEPTKKRRIQRGSFTEVVRESVQTSNFRDQKSINEFSLHRPGSSDISNNSAPCTIASTYSVNSSSHQLASQSQDNLNGTEMNETLPSTQSTFNLVGRQHASSKTFVKTETETDMYEEPESVFTTESINEDYQENSLLHGKDEVTKVTMGSVHNTSTSKHQYSHFASSLLESTELQGSDNLSLPSQQTELSTSQGVAGDVDLEASGPGTAEAWRTQRPRRPPSKATDDDDDDGDDDNDDAMAAATSPAEAAASDPRAANAPAKRTLPQRSANARHLCLICHKAFSTRCKLRVHWRTHTGDKPYKCHECGYACSDSSNMRRHRLQHFNARSAVHATASDSETAEIISALCETNYLPPKRHVCPECHKVFNAPYRLRIHRRIHFGDKPYKCPECEYACNDSSNMKRHQLNHLNARGISTPDTDMRQIYPLPVQTETFESVYDHANTQNAEVTSCSSSPLKDTKR